LILSKSKTENETEKRKFSKKYKSMLEIDGAQGEGGGQIIRTAVGLSALTKTPVKIFNIRSKRNNPGLRPQHLSAVNAVSTLCGARVYGLFVGSKNIEFYPGEVNCHNLVVDVGTAGSVALVLQSLLIASLVAKKEISFRIIGGTDIRFAPSVDYMSFVVTPILNLLGYRIEVKQNKRGYYPRGGGLVDVVVYPPNFIRLNLVDRGKVLKIFGISHAHSMLKSKSVAERQRESAEKILSELNVETDIKIEYCDALSLGSGVMLYALTENSVLGSSSLGEIGKSSESVGKEAALNLISEIEKGGAVDSHMSDQILPYLALSKGVVKVGEFTNHTKTNLDIVNLFGFNLKVKGNFIYG